MSTSNFYSSQSDITAAKIKFYKDYIGTYLIKVLMTFGRCLVADLFCGPGKNGAEKGSPLVLLEEAQKMLTSEPLRKKFPNPEVTIFFNDIEPDHISNLSVELSNNQYPREIRIEKPTSKHFRDVLTGMPSLLKTRAPKFFFLDPFTYSDVQLEDIGLLMNSPYTEVLLFLPAFFAYRFSGCETEPKTQKFLKTFTTKGGAGYESFDAFMNSIREKMKNSLGIDFVRPIILDAGSKKNTLIFLTKSIHGMLLMNEIIWKDTLDGKTFIVQKSLEPDLFSKPEMEASTHELLKFEKLLLQETRTRKIMTNADIIQFAIKEGFLPRHAEDVIKKHSAKFTVTVTDGKRQQAYISRLNINKARSIIKYIG